MNKKWMVPITLLFVSITAGRLVAEKGEEPASPFTAERFRGLAFRSIGPALTSGRIADIAIDPRNASTWYVAVGSGGVWKTVNAGTTWEPIFDDQTSYSIGCLAIDPRQPDIVWVGTGENVSGRHVGFGDGVYKSLNGGKTWSKVGLSLSEHIGRILIDPRDPQVAYVAAEGPLWKSGGERGLYKTIDGGRTWTCVLSISPDTGVTDVAADPRDPDILYAAAYQRRRSVAAFMAGGPESGIHKSIDAGKSWRRLQAGLPTGHMGKIGLAVSPQRPEFVYATIEAGDKEKGFYRSADRGESWQKQNSYISSGTGPHYYQEIYADPHRFDCIYQMDVWMQVTEDGGRTFRPVGETAKHGDNHALTFHPRDADYLLSGSDGGVYETWDRGKTWRFHANLPVTQFYKLALDNALPFYNILGGTQDNGTQMGPSQTASVNGIPNSEWFFTLGADGYNCAVDPGNPDLLYAEWQIGNLVRYDRRTGESVPIQPRPAPGDAADRWNWDTPILISPHSPARLYTASQRVYRSDDRGGSWRVISPDLTRAEFRLRLPLMGRTWGADALWDHGAMSYYGTITALSESPEREGLIYVGTDDSRIQVSEDGGARWRLTDRLPGVGDRFFVNDIEADLHDADTVYIAVDCHKQGDFRPYLLKSDDRGKTWRSITSNLPDRHLVWALVQDPVKPSLLFAATEYGIFFTLDGGGKWIELTGGVPTIAFRDIEIQNRECDLVGASFGRGFYILDDYSPLRLLDAAALEREAILFPVKNPLLFILRRPFDIAGKAFQGDAYYTAPNPPEGAVITYYLKDSIRTRREQRREQEKARTDARFPDWEELKSEEREAEPMIGITIRDSAGAVVRRLAGPVTAGLHRIAWDLRYPAIDPISLGETRPLEPWESPPVGPLVVPGSFSAELTLEAGGRSNPLGGSPQPFTVEVLGLASLPPADRNELLAFQKKAGELQRVVLGTVEAVGEARNRLRHIEAAARVTPALTLETSTEVRRIAERLQDALEKLAWDSLRGRYSEPSVPSILGRIGLQLTSTAAITATTQRDYEIAAEGFTEILAELRTLIETDLKKLEDTLETAKAPWTPGRSLPKWKRE